jgi:hypothetical protein
MTKIIKVPVQGVRIFNPSIPVEELYASFHDMKPEDYDFSEGYGEEWECYEADHCQECGKPVYVPGGEWRHCDLEDTECEGYLISEGPMMNYMYEASANRVGGLENAALAIVDLPLCVVSFISGERWGNTYLALTGGGMDLSWEICLAYMRLGYLPPLHFSHLPEYAGKELGQEEKWVIDGLLTQIMYEKLHLDAAKRHLDDLEASMKNS